MKRTTRQRISAALKGRPKTEKHREAISIALKKYWATIPNENNNDYKQ